MTIHGICADISVETASPLDARQFALDVPPWLLGVLPAVRFFPFSSLPGGGSICSGILLDFL